MTKRRKLDFAEPRETTLEKVFGRKGLDGKMCAAATAPLEDVGAWLRVWALHDGRYNMALSLLVDGRSVGGFQWEWGLEPGHFYWTGAQLSDPLQGVGAFGLVAATLADFLETELGAEWLWATQASRELEPVLELVGMEKLPHTRQLPGGGTEDVELWGGPLNGRMRDHTRFRKGLRVEPEWRVAVKRRHMGVE